MVKGGLSGLRVFVVEDEAIIRAMIEDVLDEAGCQIAGVASTVEQAEEGVDLLSFDVALLDVKLHEQYTDAVARKLAARNIPFLIATGYGAENLPAQFGPAPVLPKPFGARELVEAIARILEGAQPAARGLSPTGDVAARAPESE